MNKDRYAAFVCCLTDRKNIMWKRICWIVILLTLIGVHRTKAQNTQEITLSTQGVLLTPLQYMYRNNSRIEVNSALCVINTSNEGPQWFLLSSDNWSLNKRIGSISADLMLISDIKASPDGKALAVLSVGEGHPVVEVIDLPLLLQEKKYRVLHKIDPYPGSIEIRSWEDNVRVQIGSDMLLTYRDKTSGRVPPELALSWQETFALNVLTGEISGVSDGAINPAEHYSRVLSDQQANDSEKDAALSKLLSLSSDDMTIMYLLKLLDKERDPKRILRILEELDKLRK